MESVKNLINIYFIDQMKKIGSCFIHQFYFKELLILYFSAGFYDWPINNLTIFCSDESSPRPSKRKLRREWLKIFDLLEKKEVWALGVANLGLTVRFVCIYIYFQMSSEIKANVLMIKNFGSFATNLVIILVPIDFLKWQH